MADYKKEAAIHAAKLIERNCTIGIGAGGTMAYLIDAIIQIPELSRTLTFATPSEGTLALLNKYQLKVMPAEKLDFLDLYFDGCDQVDTSLNALKSGGGIHTYEKILAAMAKRFILLGDIDKLVPELNTQFPLTVEVIPAALASVNKQLLTRFPNATIHPRPTWSPANNYLLDVRFNNLPALNDLHLVKLIPGVVDHSLFFQMAHSAVIAGPDGIKVINRSL